MLALTGGMTQLLYASLPAAICYQDGTAEVHICYCWSLSFTVQMLTSCNGCGSGQGREQGIPNALLRWVADEHKDKRDIDLDISQWSIE
jgi:hypothetical protein